eukprot:7384862-Pyramimonas_sp.AAC.1
MKSAGLTNVWEWDWGYRLRLELGRNTACQHAATLHISKNAQGHGGTQGHGSARRSTAEYTGARQTTQEHGRGDGNTTGHT